MATCLFDLCVNINTHHLVPFFFFTATATTEIYTLSLHDALPICRRYRALGRTRRAAERAAPARSRRSSSFRDRKSTRLNSSHVRISYAVFCLKKKKKHHPQASTITRPNSKTSQNRFYEH